MSMFYSLTHIWEDGLHFFLLRYLLHVKGYRSKCNKNNQLGLQKKSFLPYVCRK